MKRQKVVKIEPAGITLKNESTWRVTLACGAVQYRTRRKKKGTKIHPPPIWIDCTCNNCRVKFDKPRIIDYADNDVEDLDYDVN